MIHQAPSPVEPLRFSMRWLLAAIALVAVVLSCCSGVVRYGEQRRAEAGRRDDLNTQTKANIVEAVEGLRAELGRAPANQEEVEKLLGKPMPVFIHEHGVSPIKYRQTGVDSFVLDYSLWDPWYYDSLTPKAGWVCAE